MAALAVAFLATSSVAGAIGLTATLIFAAFLAVQTPVGAQELESQELGSFSVAGADVPKFIVIQAFFGSIEDSLGGDDGADPAELDSLLRELGIEPLSATEAALIGEVGHLAERHRSLSKVPGPDHRREPEATEHHQVERLIARMAALGDCYGNFLRAVAEISTSSRSEAIDRRIEALFRNRITLGGEGPGLPESFLRAQEAFDRSMTEALASESRGAH